MLAGYNPPDYGRYNAQSSCSCRDQRIPFPNKTPRVETRGILKSRDFELLFMIFACLITFGHSHNFFAFIIFFYLFYLILT